MSTIRSRRAAVLSSAVIAATFAFGPLGLQASATPQSTQTATVARAPQAPRDYQRGFRDGFRSGFRQGQRSCDHHGSEPTADLSSYGTDVPAATKGSPGEDYRRGFRDGFRSGFRQGERNC